MDTLTNFVAVQNDITEQKRSQEEIDRFFTLSLDMLAIRNFEGYFIRLNPTWEKVLGYTQAELMSKPYLEFVHPDDREQTLAAASQAETGTKLLKFENRYRCKDGSYRWLEWNAAPFVEQGTIYCTARDNTERKQAEAKQAQLLLELKMVNQELKDFADIVSHDLKEPLRGILSLADWLVDDYGDRLDDEGVKLLLCEYPEGLSQL